MYYNRNSGSPIKNFLLFGFIVWTAWLGFIWFANQGEMVTINHKYIETQFQLDSIKKTHSNYEEDKFGFTGFLNGGAVSYSGEVRKELVLRQLSELFGSEILNFISYTDKIWTDEFILNGNQIIQRPHQNNGHILLQKSYMNDRLFFSGTENSTQYGGYMEGAIISAKNIADKF